jgi:hypothetical protein
MTSTKFINNFLFFFLILNCNEYIRVWCSEKPDLEWLLITNLAVNSEKDALRIVKIYRRRWLIEDYHKAVKTGFRIEDNQLKQASRIFALFGMVAVIATKLLAMREHCRLFPTTPVEKEIPERWITLVERYHRWVNFQSVRWVSLTSVLTFEPFGPLA